MADLSYLYSPLYGVEPFDPATVGAVLTGHNLVVTVWNITDKVDLTPTPGVLIQPASQNDNLLPERRAAGVQAASSRCSAQMFFTQDGEVKPPILGDANLFVLNPPPELRQQWSKAVTFNGGDPSDPANYTVTKSLMGGYMWRVVAEQTEDSQNVVSPASELLYNWGTYIDLGTYTGVMDFPLALLKTSGADGQVPEFFDRATAQGVAEMIDAVNAGAFFVPLVIASDFDNPIRLTITYPHSVARG